MPESIKVLLLAADSKGGARGLRLDRETRGALDAIRKGGETSDLELAAELAVRQEDLSDMLLRHHPKIVHFAGHGDREKGLVLNDRNRVHVQDLAALFTSFRDVRLVVLNACHTLELAEELNGVVDYVVAMEADIDDESAIDFSTEFYSALAFGHTVAFAFGLARNVTKARWADLSGVPRLLVRPGAGEWPRKEQVSPGAAESRQGITFNRVKAGSVSARNQAPSDVANSASQDIEMSDVEAKGSVTTGNDLL